MNRFLPDTSLSSRSRWPALLGFLLAAGAMFATLVMRRSRRTSDPGFTSFATAPSERSLPSVVVVSSVQPVAVSPSQTNSSVEQDTFSPRRWLAFVLFMLGLIVSFMALQEAEPAVSILLFSLLMLASVAVALWRSPQIVRRFINMILSGLRVIYQVSLWGISTPIFVTRNFILPMRVRLSSTTGRLSVGVMVVAAATFWYVAPAPSAVTAAIMMIIIGTLLMGMSVTLNPGLTAMMPIDLAGEKSINRSGWLITGAGILVLAVLAESNGGMFHIEALASVDTNLQFIMLIVGIALLVIGLGGFRIIPRLYAALLNFLRPLPRKPVVAVVTDEPLPSPLSLPSISLRFRRIHWRVLASGLFNALTAQYALLFLTLLALLLRFWELNHAYRFFIDELLNIDAIFAIIGNHDIPLLAPFSSIAAFPYLFPYWQTIGVHLFGQTYMGVRAASAVLGALAVPGLYLLAKTLFDNKTAFIAGLLLATFPPHLQFSRMGINEMGGPLFATFAFLFLARGILHNRRLDYALGGALLGLTHYFDEGSRLLFTPMIVMWMVGLLFIWKPRQRIRNYIVALIALVVVAIPIYYTLNGLQLPMAARMVNNSSGLNGGYWSVLFQSSNLQQHINNHIIPAFMIYFNQLDGTLFYRGNTVMLLVYAMPFFLLGLTYLLWHWRSPGALLVLLWVFCVSFGNSLLVASASYPRFVIVFPAVALVLAVGIRYVVPLVLQSGSLRRWQTPVMMTLGILLAFAQTNYYFNEHIPTFSQQFRDNWPHPDAEDGILRAQDFPLGTELHFVNPVPPDVNYNKGAANFLSDNRLYVDTRSPDELTTQYFLSLTCGVKHVFFLNSDDFDSLRRIQRYFVLEPPQWSPYDDIPPRKQFVMFVAQELPARTSIYSRHCS